jgi:NitT/TauT family transport system permease protein
LLLKAVDAPARRADANDLPKAPASRSVFRGWAAVLSAPAAAAVALAVHQLLPDRPDALKLADPYAGLYPLLLQGLFAAGLLLAAGHGLWRRLRPWARHYGPLLAGALGWLCLWDLTTLKTEWLPYGYLTYCPYPGLVLQELAKNLGKSLLLDVVHSLRLLLSGYVVGVSLGLLSGVLMGWFRGVRYWGMPVMKLLGPLPATALVPVAMMISPVFGHDLFYAQILLVAFAVWFPVTMLTTSGIRNVPSSYFDVARTLGAGRLYLIFRVAIPAALPTIFIGLFMGLVVSFLTFAVAETVGAKHGLAYFIEEKKSSVQYASVYGTLMILAVLCSTLLTLLFKVRDRVLRWQKGVIQW